MTFRKRTARYEMDMTEGPLMPKILRFSLPLILTSVLQLLYNAADVVVVGQYAGAQALAAVGSTGPLINMMINLFLGLSVGSSVTIARAFGAGDEAKVRRGVHTSIAIACVAGLVVGVLGFVACRPLLHLMSSPEDVIDLAALYLKIYFLGMPFNMLYNFGASILRAVGDTKRPLYFLTLSGLVNILLNLVLVIVFHMSVAGVAIATVVSQIISCVLVLVCLMKAHSCIRLDVRKLRIHGKELLGILQVGLPAGLQSSLFSISNVLIQSTVNSFGSIAMAGNAAAQNIEGFIYVSMNAVHQAAVTFSSQNLGAKKYDRVRRNAWACLTAVTVVGVTVCAVCTLLGQPLLKLYNSDAEVIRFGMIRMMIIGPTYFICGWMDVLVGQLRGIGYSIMPMIVSLTGACLLRVAWVYTIFAASPTLQTLYISYPVPWLITAAAHMAFYWFVGRKKLKRLETAGEA